MPRAYRTRRARSQTDDAVVAYFETGDQDVFDVEDERRLGIVYTIEGRQKWAEVRASLLASWVERKPGTRPWAWYEWDAPRRLDVCRAKVSGPGRQAAAIDHRRVHEFIGAAKIESEAAFLRRIGVLLPGEVERVPASAWRPVAAPQMDPDTLAAIDAIERERRPVVH